MNSPDRQPKCANAFSAQLRKSELTAAAPKPDNIFARMGFITNGSTSTDYSRKTAENTKDIFTNTEHISESIDKLTTQNVHSLA